MPPVFRGQRGLGVPVRTQTGPFGMHYWSRRWMTDIEACATRSQVVNGRDAARARYVLDVQIGWNRMLAAVGGSQLDPFIVQVEFAPLDAEAHRAVSAAVQPIGLAAALAGTVPEELAIELLPEPRRAMRWQCTCPDQPGPCSHIIAAVCVLIERLEDQPGELFRLRGYPPRGGDQRPPDSPFTGDDVRVSRVPDDTDTVRFWDADPSLPPAPQTLGSLVDLLDGPAARAFTAAVAQGNNLAALAFSADLDDLYQEIRRNGDDNVRPTP